MITRWTTAISTIPRPLMCALACAALAGCPSPPGPVPPTGPAVATPPPEPAAPPAPPAKITLSIVGTSDIHGALERMPVFGGYLANLRARRASDGAVVLVDGGDMFQGTIESNHNEGAAMIQAFEALGYDAAAIGNHEFDFGPAGPAPTPRTSTDDPRGALIERARQAKFPLLAANLIDAATGKRVQWDNAPASVVIDIRAGVRAGARAGVRAGRARVRVGIIGVTTAATPRVVMPANFAGLAVSPLADTIRAEAERLRAGGAGVDVVIVAAHAGGGCTAFDDPRDLSSCRPDEEIFEVARALPPGLVHVIVAGHTHQAVAHEVNGIAITQSGARGRAFGRVDLEVVPGAGDAPAVVTTVAIHPPRALCTTDPRPFTPEACAPGEYEGVPVTASAEVAAAIAPAIDAARAVRAEPLGVDVTAPIAASYSRESALGNLFTDLMREAVEADVAITNGGGLRADLPAGPLTYGSLYEVSPFDNMTATVTLTGDQLARVFAHNLAGRGGILSVSGVRVRARCKGGALAVDLVRDNGRRVRSRDRLVVVTSDFVATGGEGSFGMLGLTVAAPGARPAAEPGVVVVHDELMREGVARVLRNRKRALSADRRVLDPERPRIAYPGKRPVQCANGDAAGDAARGAAGP